MPFDHERLDVYQASIEMVAVSQTIATAFPKGHGDLANQLKRASTSITLNIAEGAGEHSPGDKARFYRIAKRSATECAAILDVAGVLGIGEPNALSAGRALLLRIVSMLVKMVRGRAHGHGRGHGYGHGHGE
jgi:four helix bundle protein